MVAMLQRCEDGLARTQTALRRWAEALPSATYCITLVPAAAEGTLGPEKRRFGLAQLTAAAGWLRQRNAAGCHVFGRPDDGRQVLVDDLGEEALEALRAAHRVAAAVRTSPGSHQAWITVSEQPVPEPMLTAAARLLARRFGGDPGAADAHHLGRLPGLCNRKPARQRLDGGYAWVRLLWAEAGVDPGGARLLAEAVEQSTAPLRLRPAGALSPTCLAPPLARPPRGRPRWRLAAEEHAAGEARLRAVLPAGIALDRSRLDHAIARRLLLQGAPTEFVRAVVEAGAKAGELRPIQRSAYAARTVAAAARGRLEGEGAPGPCDSGGDVEDDEEAEKESGPEPL